MRIPVGKWLIYTTTKSKSKHFFAQIYICLFEPNVATPLD